MLSLVIDRIGHTEFRETDLPDLGAADVLLDVHYVGLCGSDLNTFNGLNPLVQLPRIPGHEIGGSIAALGADVPEEFTLGKFGIVIPYTTCGHCRSCRTGRTNACQFNRTLGVQQDGAMRAQIVLNHDRLILNDSLPVPHLALVEPLSVGFHAVSRGKVSSEDTVLIIGGGMIGVGAALGAQARGARAIVSEISEQKSATLKALGIDVVLNPDVDDVEQRVKDITDGAGADVIIEAVGMPVTFRTAVEIAPFCGRVVYIGYAKSEVSYDTSLFNLKELDIHGSRNATRTDFEAVVDYMNANRDIAEQLISKIFPWSDADKALDYWNANRNETFKILIKMDSSE